MARLTLFVLFAVLPTRATNPSPVPSAAPSPASSPSPKLGTSFALTDFSPANVLPLLVADTMTITTDGSLSCALPDHVHWNSLLDGQPSPPGRLGFSMTMDNVGANCNSKALVATGHISSVASYSYGDFSIYMRAAHSPTPGAATPSNALTCFSAFIGTNGGTTQHNEVAMCIDPLTPTTVVVSYWNGQTVDNDVAHSIPIPLSFDASQSYHTYTFRWRTIGIQFLVDGALVHTSSIVGKKYPWEAMGIRVILRPLGSSASPTVYLGNAVLSVGALSYTTAPNVDTFDSATAGPTPAAAAPSPVPTTMATTLLKQPSQLPTVLPTVAPTVTPTVAVTVVPTRSPSPQPTALMTHQPSSVTSPSPSSVPTVQPSPAPSPLPSPAPTVVPSAVPSAVPSSMPSPAPTPAPSAQPSPAPTDVPTPAPSSIPTPSPSANPTMLPDVPTPHPTASPTTPSAAPSTSPTPAPSAAPSTRPSPAPSSLPSAAPSPDPSASPSSVPTTSPSLAPSNLPTPHPSPRPSARPTSPPSPAPTSAPSPATTEASHKPSAAPTPRTSASPTSVPSFLPAVLPTARPSAAPTFKGPTRLPTPTPTTLPTANDAFNCAGQLCTPFVIQQVVQGITLAAWTANNMNSVYSQELALLLGLPISQISVVASSSTSSFAFTLSRLRNEADRNLRVADAGGKEKVRALQTLAGSVTLSSTITTTATGQLYVSQLLAKPSTLTQEMTDFASRLGVTLVCQSFVVQTTSTVVPSPASTIAPSSAPTTAVGALGLSSTNTIAGLPQTTVIIIAAVLAVAVGAGAYVAYRSGCFSSSAHKNGKEDVGFAHLHNSNPIIGQTTQQQRRSLSRLSAGGQDRLSLGPDARRTGGVRASFDQMSPRRPSGGVPSLSAVPPPHDLRPFAHTQSPSSPHNRL